MIFVVDELLGENRYEVGFPSLADAAKEAGHTVYKVKYIPIAQAIAGDIPSFTVEEPVVAYGTIQFCNVWNREYGRYFSPGTYFNKYVKSYEKFAVQYGKLMLNSHYVILPFAEIVRQVKEDFKPGFNAFFIKPLSGLKEFTGQVIHDHHELDVISPHHPIDPDTLCVVAPKSDIQAEFRYVIVDGRVITGSEYRWDNVLDVRIDTHPECDKLADHVAKNKWQPDSVYVCDIALTGDGSCRIIELNAFSSSGLYACDTHKIVAAVTTAAEREYNGDFVD